MYVLKLWAKKNGSASYGLLVWCHRPFTSPFPSPSIR